jgi:hypothetical protein
MHFLELPDVRLSARCRLAVALPTGAATPRRLPKAAFELARGSAAASLRRGFLVADVDNLRGVLVHFGDWLILDLFCFSPEVLGFFLSRSALADLLTRVRGLWRPVGRDPPRSSPLARIWTVILQAFALPRLGDLLCTALVFFSEEDTIRLLTNDFWVVGDIHGQFLDLFPILTEFG